MSPVWDFLRWRPIDGAFRSSAWEDSRENENLQKGVALHPVELLLGVALLEICYFLEKTKSYPRWLLWFMVDIGLYICTSN